MHRRSVILMSLILSVVVGNVYTDIKHCPAGSYCPANMKTGQPIPCPAGTFSNVGQGACTPCQSGFHATKPGSTYCTICPAGYYCPYAHLSPLPCPLGQANDQRGQISCTNCNIGYYTTDKGST
ncbi:unnamed protein product, partial [Didymodactylos carnosus]